MASVPFNDVPAGRSIPKSARPRDLHLFRFGLRQMLACVAFLCVLLAGMVIAKGIGALIVLMVGLIIAAHLLSTALGSRLRESADRRNNETPMTSGETPHSSFAIRHSSFTLRRSSWHGRDRAALRRLPFLIGAGIVLGGTAGGAFFAVIGNHTSIGGIVVGAFSLAVLGGWCAFLASSFYAIFRDGLREAIAEQQKDEARAR